MDVLLCAIQYDSFGEQEHLHRKGHVGAMRALERETGVEAERLGEDAAFLRALVLDGHWNDAITLIKVTTVCVTDVIGRGTSVARGEPRPMQGLVHHPVQLTTSRVGNLNRLTHTFAICVTMHTRTYITFVC